MATEMAAEMATFRGLVYWHDGGWCPAVRVTHLAGSPVPVMRGYVFGADPEPEQGEPEVWRLPVQPASWQVAAAEAVREADELRAEYEEAFGHDHVWNPDGTCQQAGCSATRLAQSLRDAFGRVGRAFRG